MRIRIHCPSCQRALDIKERLIGKTVNCPACGEPFVACAPAGKQEGREETTTPETAATQREVPAEQLSRIGRFQIKAALGQGGFGTVYRAYDPILDREVAIKIPRAGTKGAERLIREARAAAPLRHPNIVAVYDAGADGDDLYIATEFVDGQTLADEAGQKSIDPKLAGEWVKSLAEGLAYAHHEGVIHRDVKPQNVMIGKSGRAQLMDFGLAFSEANGESAEQGAAGTPAYMSPEQARCDNDQIGPASDQYGLGAVLYELLTGKKPFDGGPDTVKRIAEGGRPSAPRLIRPLVSRDLEAVCLKAMASTPQHRYRDCRGLAEDLGRWLNDELVSARRYSPLELMAYWARKHPSMFGWTAAAICLVALLLGAGAAYGVNRLLRQPVASGGTTATPVLASTSVTAASALGAGNQPKQLVEQDGRAEMLLYGRLLDRTRLAYRERDVILADRWLEETRWDYRNWEYNYLRRIVTGGWKTIRGHGGEVTAVAVHPDGRRFASATANGEVAIWEIATGKRLGLAAAQQCVTSLAFSPNGEFLAVATGIQPQPTPMGMGGPPPGPVPVAPSPPAEPAPVSDPAAPGGPALAVRPQYAVLLLDAQSLAEVGIYREHAGPIASIAFSLDGIFIASGGVAEGPTTAGAPPGAPSQIQGEVRVWRVADRTTERRLTAPGAPVRRLAYSADGKRIFASSGMGAFGQLLAWKLDPSGPPLGAISGITPAAPIEQLAAPPAVVAAQPTASNVAVETKTAEADGILPETVLPGGFTAVATNPQAGEIVAATAIDTWLLEAGRRRVSGNMGVLHHWFDAAGEGAELRGLPASVSDLAFAPEPGPFGNFTLAAAGGDALLASRPGIVTLRDPAYEFGALVEHLGHTSTLTAIAFRPDGKQFVSGSADGTLKVWSAEVHPEVVKLGPTRSANRVAFGRDGRFVAVAERSQAWTEVRGAISAFGPDGPVVPTEKPRGAVKLYDIRNGSELGSFTAGPGDVLGLATAPDLEWIAAGGEDARIHVWNAATGQERRNFAAPGIVRCLAASADGQFLAAACGGAASAAAAPAALPAPAPMAPSQVSTEHTTYLVSHQIEPAVNGDSAQAQAPSEPGRIAIWRMEDGKQIVSWEAHLGAALSVAFSPDGQQIVSSGADRTVRLWNVADQQEVRKLEDFDGEIIDLAFRPTGEDIAGVGFDPCRPDQPGAAIIWSVADGKRRLKLTSVAGMMYGVTYSQDGKRLATGGGAWQGSLSRPGEVIVWDAETGIELLPLVGRPGRGHKLEGYTVSVTETVNDTVVEKVPEARTVDGQQVTTLVERVKTVPRQVMRTKSLSGHVEWEEPGTVLGVAFSGDGRSLAAACEDGSALVWDAERCQPHDTLRWRNGQLFCAATSPDGKLIATGGDCGDHCDCMGLVRVYDATTGRLAREIETTAGSVRAIAFSPDSQRVITGGGCGEWFQADCHFESAPVRSDVISRFGAAKQSASSSGRGQIWDVAAGNLVTDLTGHEQTITCVAVHPKDGRIATAGDDGTLRLWDAKSGKELRRWSALARVTALTFSPSGQQLAVATATGKVMLGNPDQEGEFQLVSDKLGQASAADLAFDLEGKHLIVVHQPAAEAEPASATGAVMITTTNPQSGELLVWDVAAIGEPRQVSLPEPSSHVAFDAATGCLAIGGSRGSTLLVDLESGGERLRLSAAEGVSRMMAMPNGRLASMQSDRSVKVWHIRSSLDRDSQCRECAHPRQKTIELKRGNGNVFQSKVRFARQANLAVVGGHVMRQADPAVAHPVRTIDAASGQSQHSGGHYDVVRSVAVRPDGQQLASVGQDQNLYLWNPDGSSNPTASHPNKVMKVVYSRDGKTIATSTAFDGRVFLWNSETREEIRRFQVEPTTAFALTFDRDGKQLVTGGLSGAIKVWEVATGNLIRQWPAHEGTIQSLALSGDGKLLASCGHNKKVMLWDFEKGEAQKTIEGFAGPAWDCAFNFDDTLLAVGAMDPVVRIYRVETGEIAKEIPDHGSGVWSLAFSPDGSRLAYCGRELPLVIWNWQSAEKLATSAEAGECLAWWPDGTRLAAGSVIHRPQSQPNHQYDAIITLNDPSTGSVVDTITMPDVARPEFDVSADGRYVAVGRQDGVALVWDRQAHRITAECRAHQGPVRALAFHPRQAQFATAGDGGVKLWSVEGQELRSLPHTASVAALAFDPSGEFLASGDATRTTYLWKVSSGEQVRALKGHYGEVCGLSFNGDGTRLAATSRGYYNDRWLGDLKVWDIKTGQRVLSVPSHTWWEASVAYHPTLPHIASTGKDHTLQIFHAETGQLLLSLPTHGHLAGSMSYAPDGKRLLALLAGNARLIDPAPQPRPFGVAAVAPARQDQRELAAAQWVLEQGGQVQVLIDGIAPLDVGQAADLPSDPFVVSRVNLEGKQTFADADLAVLKDLLHLAAINLTSTKVSNVGVEFVGKLPELQEIYVSGTGVTDEVLAKLGNIARLRVLHANDTKISGAGLVHLRRCLQLQNIELHRTLLDDSALAHVSELPALTDLGVAGTKVTEEGIGRLKASKPELNVGR